MTEPQAEQPIVLPDTQLLDHSMTILQTHIPLTAHGYVCQTADLWRVLLAAASGGISIDAVCADLETVPNAGYPLGDYSRLSRCPVAD